MLAKAGHDPKSHHTSNKLFPWPSHPVAKPRAAEKGSSLLCWQGEIAPQLVNAREDAAEEEKDEGCWLQKIKLISGQLLQILPNSL